MVDIEDAIVARYESHGESFEILIDPAVVDAFAMCDPEALVNPAESVPTALGWGDRSGFDRLRRPPARAG